MKYFFIPILVLLCLYLNSCSRLDLAVQFANTYVAHKADDYFDLTRVQKKWLKASFENDFMRVQKTIFPQVASEMIKASDIIQTNRPVDAATVMISYERIKNLFYDGMRMFTSSALAFAEKLHPNQIAHFQKEFDIKMSDIKEDESPESFYKKMKKHFDSWMGGLSSSQKNELNSFSKSNPPLTAEKIFNRQLLAHEFVNAYPDQVRRNRFITKITTQFDQAYESKFSKTTKDRNNKIMALVASILNKMTDNQRQTLVETLRDRANQLLKISKAKS